MPFEACRGGDNGLRRWNRNDAGQQRLDQQALEAPDAIFVCQAWR